MLRERRFSNQLLQATGIATPHECQAEKHRRSVYRHITQLCGEPCSVTIKCRLATANYNGTRWRRHTSSNSPFLWYFQYRATDNCRVCTSVHLRSVERQRAWSSKYGGGDDGGGGVANHPRILDGTVHILSPTCSECQSSRSPPPCCSYVPLESGLRGDMFLLSTVGNKSEAASTQSGDVLPPPLPGPLYPWATRLLLYL